MARQVAVDFNRVRVRAVEIDGTLKAPRITGFAAASIAAGTAEEDPAADAVSEVIRSGRLARDPSACALDSFECTFREMDLPFTRKEQIEKVLKFEAESQLQLVDIDEVVVDYHKLGEGRNGAHLLIMAHEKKVIRRRLAQLQSSGVDPHFADLHLLALYTALRETGFFVPPLEEEAEEPGERPLSGSEVVLVIECDQDATNLLVVSGGELIGARALRLAARALEEGESLPALGELDDDEFVVLDIDDEEPAPATSGHGEGGADTAVATAPPRIVTTRNFFGRLRREVQRTLFPLGLSEETPRVLALGAPCREPGFVERMQGELDRAVEVARPFDQFENELDPADLEHANAEGAAALGVALRLLGAEGSRVDFRQEDVRYARRLDQLKVPLVCCAIAVFVLVFLNALSTTKKILIREKDMAACAEAALSPYQAHTADLALRDQVQNGAIEPLAAVRRIRTRMEQRAQELAGKLGREGGIPLVPSGLDCLNELITTLDAAIPQMGRLELNSIDLDLTKSEGEIVLQGVVEEQRVVDVLVSALRGNTDLVASVDNPRVQQRPDGRQQFNQLVVKLTDQWVVQRGQRVR